MPTARASRGPGQVAQGGELPSSGNLCEKRFDIIDKVLMIFKANAYAQDEIVCIHLRTVRCALTGMGATRLRVPPQDAPQMS